MLRFTDAKLRALKVKAERYEEVEDGATGLAVRVSVRGIKSFQYLYRFDGRPRRLTLGIYRDITDAAIAGASHDRRGLPYLTLADARVRLAEARRLRDSGIDPATVAIMEHRAERKTKTMSELIDVYLAKWAKPHKKASSAAEDERMLKKDVRPVLGDRKLSSVTRRDLIALLDDVAARAPVMSARHSLKNVRRALGAEGEERAIGCEHPEVRAVHNCTSHLLDTRAESAASVWRPIISSSSVGIT